MNNLYIQSYALDWTDLEWPNHGAKWPDTFKTMQYLWNSPLMSISCSSDICSPLIGSVPFSAIYFSISLLSNTQFEDGETQGCSGTSLLTANWITHKTTSYAWFNHNCRWVLTVPCLLYSHKQNELSAQKCKYCLMWSNGIWTTPPRTIRPTQLVPDLQTTSPSFFYPLPSQTSS